MLSAGIGCIQAGQTIRTRRVSVRKSLLETGVEMNARGRYVARAQ